MKGSETAMKHSYDPERILSGAHFQPLDRILANRFGAENGDAIKKSIREQLCALLESHQDDDDALWEESSNYILPSIAVYLILKNHVGPQEALDLFRMIYFEAAYEGAAFLQKKAEDRAFRERFAHDMAGNKEGERGGFRFHLVKDDPTGAEFHVLQCPYCDLCATHQCRELIPIFCECDDIVYGNIHPLLRWERTETLGRGQERCDFKFSILSTEKTMS